MAPIEQIKLLSRVPLHEWADRPPHAYRDAQVDRFTDLARRIGATAYVVGEHAPYGVTVPVVMFDMGRAHVILWDNHAAVVATVVRLDAVDLSRHIGYQAAAVRDVDCYGMPLVLGRYADDPSAFTYEPKSWDALRSMMGVLAFASGWMTDNALEFAA